MSGTPRLRRRGDAWTIRGPLCFGGVLQPPTDKSIAHRAVLFAALGAGTSCLRMRASDDVFRTLEAVRRLGITVHDEGRTWRIHGRGLRGLRPANSAVDCGNSGTTMRLLAGLLAAQPFATLLVGDASLSRRPMARVVEPLKRMRARIECRGAAARPPLWIQPPDAAGLLGMHHELQVDSAQVRSALLLAGLYAAGPTSYSPPGGARDHTERMLAALGLHLQRDPHATRLSATIRHAWPAFDLDVPGDLSAAAFYVAAAAVRPGSRLQIRGVGLNPGRTRYLKLLQRAGAGIAFRQRGVRLGEPWGDLQVHGGTLGAMRLAAADVAPCIDEVPALLAGAAVGGCVFELADAAELRVKESDRIEAMAHLLRCFGARVRVRADGLRLEATRALVAAEVDSGGDHRVAMAAALLAAGAAGTSRVRGIDCVATSYPSFAQDFLQLGRPIS